MQKNILLIDDDEDELKIFTDAVRQVPGEFKCAFAPDSEQGLVLLKSFVPDYIFVDFNIPKINGLQFISAVKNERHLREIPVFLYSTSISDEINKLAEILGAAGSIEKTFSIGMLAGELKTILAEGRRSNYVLYNGK
ncbi:MAG: response regulator [Chitinophagaceae bacterium]